MTAQQFWNCVKTCVLFVVVLVAAVCSCYEFTNIQVRGNKVTFIGVFQANTAHMGRQTEWLKNHPHLKHDHVEEGLTITAGRHYNLLRIVTFIYPDTVSSKELEASWR